LRESINGKNYGEMISRRAGIAKNFHDVQSRSDFLGKRAAKGEILFWDVAGARADKFLAKKIRRRLTI